MNEKQLLPKKTLDKAVKSSNELGWKRQDFIETILSAERANLVAVGGQVQFLFPNMTCELYWLSYKSNENWAEYCHRAAQEIIE